MSEKVFPSFYFDEDVSVIVAKILRAHGFDVICASEIKLHSKTDEEQLKFATKEERIFITHNIRDFIKLHKEYFEKGSFHRGIILAIRRRSNYEFAKRLLMLLQQISPHELDNQIRYI